MAINVTGPFTSTAGGPAQEVSLAVGSWPPQIRPGPACAPLPGEAKRGSLPGPHALGAWKPRAAGVGEMGQPCWDTSISILLLIHSVFARHLPRVR